MMALDPAIMIVLTTVLAAGGAALVMTVDRRQRLNTRRVAAIVNFTDALSASEASGKDAQTKIADLGSRLNTALAQKVLSS